MTQSDLWSIYTTKNPTMGTNDSTPITLTSRGLKKLFDTTWEQAHQVGFENGKAWEKEQNAKVEKASGGLGKGSNIFDEMFGGKKF